MEQIQSFKGFFSFIMFENSYYYTHCICLYNITKFYFRHANRALAETYYKPGIVYKSPVYKSIDVQKNKAIISFDNVPTGLMAKDKNITALLIAVADKKFYPASAKIDNDKLIVWSKQVTQPAAVRFSFTNAGVGNLFSKEARPDDSVGRGLPVAPFRTDDWELDTSK